MNEFRSGQDAKRQRAQETIATLLATLTPVLRFDSRKEDT